MAAPVLIYADSIRSADMRHAVPLGSAGSVPLRRDDGTRHVFSNSMEAARLRELGLFEVHVSEEFGIDELIASGLDRREISAQLALRSVESLGPKRFAVPDTFPVWLADRLRADGFELDGRPGALRRPPPREDGGAARRDAARAEGGRGGDGRVPRAPPPRPRSTATSCLLDGEPLTVERVKAAMNATFAAHDTTADEYIVAPGAQGAVGHDMGSGPIPPGTPLVVDIWPRDNGSASTPT